MTEDIFVGDIGTTFRGRILDNGDPLDISGATEKKILFKKPDGSVVEKDATFPAGHDGTDGILEYTTITGDLDTAGNWSWRAKIVGATTERLTSKLEFEVYT